MYYAVYYDQKWFIGRVIEQVDEKKFKINFPRENLKAFYWPKEEDIDIVSKSFIL